MSAIFGLVHLNDQPVAPVDLERMSAALQGLGADGGGIWTQGTVGLAQRLMCFTPEDRFERQPLASADARCVLVSDGRIDNRIELLGDLKLHRTSRAAHHPQSPVLLQLPDGELILRAYEEWAEECVHHLVGVYAFCLWDALRERLFAARSPISAPPLFYYSTPQVLAFATMPRGLHALPFVPRALDEENVANLMLDMAGDVGATLYRDIYYLPTGHSLTAGREGVSVRRFWRPDLRREIRFPRDEDYVAAFEGLLERVVSDYLRSATPVGVMMSGGLDSSSVAVTAARLLQPRAERVAAFTEAPRAGFEGPVPDGRYADETPFVQAIAAMHDNLALSLIRTDGRTFLDDLDRLFAHLEMPCPGTSNRVWVEAILREARRRGIGVVLDGSQGNLTASWNGSGLLPTLVCRGCWVRALREARALARRGEARSPLRALIGGGHPARSADSALAMDRAAARPAASQRRSTLARLESHPSQLCRRPSGGWAGPREGAGLSLPPGWR